MRTKKINIFIMSIIALITMFVGINVNAQSYDIDVNGVAIDDDNLTVPCGAGTATFDPSTKTLTLNNATLDTSADDMAIITDNNMDGPLNIVLIGTNVIEGNGYDILDSNYGQGVNITGTGSLTATDLYYGFFAEMGDGNFSVNGVTLNIECSDQAIYSNQNITITNATVNITATGVDTPIVEAGGNVTVTNSNVTISGETSCINLTVSSGTSTFTLNSGTVRLTSTAAYALAGAPPDDSAIVINGGKLVLNGSSGGTNISDVTIANGYDITQGSSLSDTGDVVVSESVTINGTVAWVDHDASTRPTGDVLITVKYPNGTTAASTTTSASQNWQYSMKVAKNDDNDNPITYTLAIAQVSGYNASITGFSITMVLEGMEDDTIIPNLTTYTTVVASGTIKDGNGTTILTHSGLNSGELTGDTSSSAVTSKINEFKSTLNEWANENNATGSTTSEEITSTYFESSQVGATHYNTMDEVVAAYENMSGTGVLNIRKVQTYTMVYEATENTPPEQTTISGSITWDDSSDQDGKRPGAVTVSIKNGASTVATKTVYESDNWAYTFEGLFVTDDQGQTINYTVAGSPVADYTVTSNGNNLTYSHTPEKVNINGTISWDDDNNALGTRPEQISVILKANGTVVDTQTKTSDSTNYFFGERFKYTGGEEIEYTIEVGSVENYRSQISGYNITMSSNQKVIGGSITFVDEDNINGSRPLQVQVTVKANGATQETITASSVTNWNYSLTVNKYDQSNNLINYTVSFPDVDGYQKSVSGFNATYTYTVQTVDVNGTITWSDGSNRDGKRPNKVTVTLYNGATVVESKDVSGTGNTWNYAFEGLNKKDDQGQTINYTVQAQDSITGYELTSSGNNFTYSHTPEKITISGTVSWNDNNDVDGLRPNSLTVLLKNGSTTVDNKTVNSSDWSYTFENMYKYANGTEINYTLVPESAVTGYTYEQQGYNLSFSHTHETVTISGSITWDDNNNHDGLRPENLEVAVYNGSTKVSYMEVSAANNWSYTFPDLDKLDGQGNPITYTVKSNENLSGYTYSVNGYNITYSHTNETVKVNGTITWNDNNNALNLRPNKVVVTLLENGVESQTTEVEESDNWQFEFANLPKYKNSSEVTYTVSSQSLENYNLTTDANNFTYECNKVRVSGKITFNDASNQDGKRPNTIKVSIKNGDATVKEVDVTSGDDWEFSELVNKYDSNDNEVTYTVSYPDVTDYEKTVSGNNASYSHTPEKTDVSGTITFEDNNNQDQIRPSKVTITLKNGSTTVGTKEVNISGKDTNFEFTNVDKYASGEQISYTFTGSSVSDYEVSVSGTTITYTHVVAKTRVEGKIIWNDNDNQDGYRPGSVVVELSTGATKEVTEADDWEFAFTGLDKYDNGELINYSVSSNNSLDHYTYSKDGYEITYSHTPEKKTLTGSLIFSDSNNQDGIRPTTVTLNLDNGEQTITRNVNVTGDTTNFEINDVDKFAHGVELTYTITPQSVTGYTVANEGNDFTFTHETEKVTVSGKVNFSDNNNQDGKRPSSVEVSLSTGATATANAASNWEYEFTNLPKNENGEAIEYSVSFPTVQDYSKEVSGKNVTYTHTPEKTTLEGTITWNDENDKYGFRPNEVTVTIKNGSTTVKTIKVNSSNSWSYQTTLDKYANGEEINYSISTNEVSNYELVNNSPNFTYKCTKVKITTKVTFSDDDDAAGVRPSKVNIGLYGNSGLVQTIELNTSNNFTKTVTVNRFANDDSVINYTITPETIDSYEVSTSGFNATYTYNGEAKSKVEGKITWNDASSSTRPDKVTVVLYQNGVEYTRKSVTASDSWKYSFKGLPKTDGDGLDYTYTIDVEGVNGYTPSIDGNNITFDKITYRIIEGNKQLFTISEDSEATFVINADYNLFDKLYIDNKLVDRSNYEVTEGSTVITLKDSFTKTLASGQHSLRVTFTDGGEASGTFTVERLNTSSSVEEIMNPNTGDKLILFLILLVTSTLGISVTTAKLRKAN